MKVRYGDNDIDEGVDWDWKESLRHQFFDFLMLVGLRDRLRCPKCTAVGTWKPHGGWCDNLHGWWVQGWKDLKPAAVWTWDRRWVCKYCGYTRDKEGEHYGAPNAVKGVWDIKGPDSIPTPKEAVEQLCGKTWPWKG